MMKEKYLSYDKHYSVTGWNGTVHSLTPQELYERVLKDSESDYNWIASATELVKTCSEPDFPDKYAKKIKIIILNCFANLELKKEYPSHGKSTDAEAVSFCYSSLTDSDEKTIAVKEKYLNAIIKAVIKYDTDSVRFPIYSGSTYYEICEKWRKEKFDEYASKKSIDFEQLRKDLYDDFNRTIKSVKDEGILTPDHYGFKLDDTSEIKIICK